MNQDTSYLIMFPRYHMNKYSEMEQEHELNVCWKKWQHYLLPLSSEPQLPSPLLPSDTQPHYEINVVQNDSNSSTFRREKKEIDIELEVESGTEIKIPTSNHDSSSYRPIVLHASNCMDGILLLIGHLITQQYKHK